jgi:hypothetical protein
MRLVPKPSSNGQGVQPHVMPPGAFVTAVVELTVMGAAERNGEFVADLGTERLGLGETDMVWV